MASITLKVRIDPNPDNSAPEDHSEIFSYVRASGSLQDVTVNRGNIELGKDAPNEIVVSFVLITRQASWGSQAYDLSFGESENDDATNILWIAPGKDKPKGPWKGEGISSLKYDHGTQTVSFLINRAKLGPGIFTYTPAVLAKSKADQTAISFRDDPQIKNGNTLQMTFADNLPFISGMAAAILAMLVVYAFNLLSSGR